VSLRSLLTWCTVWAAAFGVLEGAVVVYLRHIAYPDGFAFPLREVPSSLLTTELVREATTLVMLLGVACLAVRGGMRRFAVFSFCFGVWDIVYYLALAAFLDWPASLLEWDVLFLIPLPWTSPVLAPVLVSVALIGSAVLILSQPEGTSWDFLRPVDWAVEVAAGLTIIGSFLWNVPAVAAEEVPSGYPWWLFGIGWGGGAAWFAWRWSRRRVVADGG